MRIYLILLLTILFYACNNSKNYRHVSPRYVELADEIRSGMAQKLAEKYHMKAIGTVGGLAKCVNLLGLSFQIRGPLTQEQLRLIIIGCVEEFLSAVNADEEIRPYLCTYPFTAEGIEITVFVIDAQGRSLYDPDIGVASERRGALEYMITDKTDTFKYKSIISESYDDALKIVRGQ